MQLALAVQNEIGSPMQLALAVHNDIRVPLTDSGETFAYIIRSILPIISQFRLRRGDGPAIVVFAPNHELAVQIREEFAEFERNSQFN